MRRPVLTRRKASCRAAQALLAAIVAIFLTHQPSATFAQAAAPPGEHDVTELAKKTQNPVGDVISLPFQFNFNTGGDLEDRTFFNLNFQPVIPFRVTDGWNVIARTILPVDSIPGPAGQRFSGVGDIQQQLYFTSSRPGKIIWGVGPMFSFPTATTSPLETGSWAAGPGAVVLTMAGPWVIGGLFQQFWTFADSGDDTETNLFVVQPFVNYNFGKGWALGFSPVMSANWDAPTGQEWTVPLGLGISRTTVFDGRPMTVGAQYYYNVERPDGSAGQQLRLIVSLIYPKGPHR